MMDPWEELANSQEDSCSECGHLTIAFSKRQYLGKSGTFYFFCDDECEKEVDICQTVT